MARQSASDRQNEPDSGGAAPELSLDAILAEYLAVSSGEYTGEAAPQAAPRTAATLPPEEAYEKQPPEDAPEYDDEDDQDDQDGDRDGRDNDDRDVEDRDDEEPLRDEGYDDRDDEDGQESYEEDYGDHPVTAPSTPAEEPEDEDEDVKIYAPASRQDEDDEDEDVKIYHAPKARRDEGEPPEERTEGFEDDEDFYAGARTEPETDDEAERPKSRRAARKGNLFQRLHSGALALLAVASLRRQRNLEQQQPEPEDTEREMPARQAARFYARQMPALRLRALAALGVCLLLLWVTFSCCLGWPLPGRLQTDVKLCSLVCAVGELTVMLIGLDIVTAGLMSLLRGRPGAETLIVAACLTALGDVISVVVTGGGARGLPPCVVPALALTGGLWAAWLSCMGYRCTFLALHRIREPYSVTGERIEGRKERFLIKSRLPSAGFVRRTEEPSMSESLSASAAPFLLLGCLAASLLLTLANGDTGAFFHVLALLTSLTAGVTWLPAFPLLFSRAAQGLLRLGSAVAGWAGARDMGVGPHLILTDTDVFPVGTLEITGIRIPDKVQADKVISYTGSLLAAAGTGMAATFSELMRRSNSVMQTVEEFTAGEGGVRAFLSGEEVRVGAAGYMHLSGVKLPSRLKYDDALYTAIGGKLSGVFLFNYRAAPAVQKALATLCRGRRKPLFAVRDFNVDPQLISRRFGVSSEWFEFPGGAERYRISAIPASGKSPVAGITAQDGLNALVTVAEYGTRLYEYGRICALAALIAALLGVALAALPIWTGAWQRVSAANLTLYQLLWLAPMCLLSLNLRK